MARVHRHRTAFPRQSQLGTGGERGEVAYPRSHCSQPLLGTASVPRLGCPPAHLPAAPSSLSSQIPGARLLPPFASWFSHVLIFGLALSVVNFFLMGPLSYIPSPSQFNKNPINLDINSYVLLKTQLTNYLDICGRSPGSRHQAKDTRTTHTVNAHEDWGHLGAEGASGRMFPMVRLAKYVPMDRICSTIPPLHLQPFLQ